MIANLRPSESYPTVGSLLLKYHSKKEKSIFDMDRDLLVDPPTFFEKLSEFEFSDRFYSSLDVLPRVLSASLSIICFFLIMNQYTETEQTVSITARTDFRLFVIAFMYFTSLFFRFKELFLSGRALKLYEASHRNKAGNDFLSFGWNELFLALLWILNSFITPIFLLVSFFMISVIFARRLGIYPRNKNVKQSIYHY